MTHLKNLAEDLILWAVVTVFCTALLIDYVTGTKIAEWLI